MPYPTTADTAPLADALRKIADITDRSESDAEMMVAMLNEIVDLASNAKTDYFADVVRVSREEVEQLRHEVARLA
jgi:hypothetical protein